MGTVKSRLNAAHRKLQDLLGGGDDNPRRGGRKRRRGGLLLLLAWVWRLFCQTADALLLPQSPALATI